MKLSPSRIAAAAKAYGKKIYKNLVKPTIRAAKKSMGMYEPTGPKVKKKHKIGSEEWAETGQWVQVISSNVKAIKFDEDDRQLFVEFNGGSVYVYYNLPATLAKGLFDAPSIGKYLHWKIKVKGFSYSRLR